MLFGFCDLRMSKDDPHHVGQLFIKRHHTCLYLPLSLSTDAEDQVTRPPPRSMFGKQVSSLSVYGSDCGLERRRSKSKTQRYINIHLTRRETVGRHRSHSFPHPAPLQPRRAKIFPTYIPCSSPTSGTSYLPSPPPSLLLLTQIKSVVPVDLHPERVHPGVPLGVRVPQHLAVQVHDFLALSLRVLRHVYRKVQKGGGLAGDTVLPGGHGSWGIRSAAT